MARIAIIGAGGVIFSQNLIKDILLDETLRKTSEVVLMDIDQGRLDLAVKFGEIPGGIFRGLRTLKDLFEVLDTMEEVCPGAYLLNYVNPMSMNTIALSRRAKTVKVIGLCHSVRGTLHTLSNYLGIDARTVRYYAAGVNHQAFMLKFEQHGENLYPKIRELLNKPEVYKKDKVRFEILRHFDYFPTESSGHGSEYIPYIRKRQDLIDKFCSCDYPDISDGINWATMSAGVSGASTPSRRTRPSPPI